MQLALVLFSLLTHLGRMFRQFGELGLLRLEQALGFCEEHIGIVNFRLLLRPLGFRCLHIELIALDQRRQFLRPLAIEFDPAVMSRDLILQPLHFRARFVDPGVDFLELAALGRDFVFVFLDLAFGGSLLFVVTPRGRARLFQLRLERIELGARMMRVEHLEIGQQRLVAARLPRLPLERTDLAFDFLDDVAQAQQICLRRLELAHGLAFLPFVFGDPGGFFEDRAPIFRTRTEDLVDPALLHDGVGAAPHAGVGEKTVDVFQPADCLVEQVFRETVAVDAACDAHFVPIDAEIGRAVGEREGDFGVADRLTRIGPAEDNIGHFATTQGFGRLLAEDPADCIEDVRFSAPVRSDDGGHAFVEIEDRFVGEGFEPKKLERLEMHAMGKLGGAYNPLQPVTSKINAICRGRTRSPAQDMVWSASMFETSSPPAAGGKGRTPPPGRWR